MSDKYWTRREALKWGVASTVISAETNNLIKTVIADDTLPRSLNESDFPIWDSHCHLSSVPGKTPEEKINRFLSVSGLMGIERVVIFMGWPFAIDPSPEVLKKQNDQVLRAMKVNPDRVFGYVYVNPNHVDASLDEMDRCFQEKGMVGIKLWVASRCDESALAPILRKAEKYNAVVFQHTWIKTTGNLKGESTPLQLIDLAKKFPETKIICGHAGGVWEMGIRAIRPYPNIYVETAGFAPTAGFLEMAVRELGPERIIYGSDAGGRSFASQISKVLGANISDTDKKQIFKDNYKKLITER